MGLITTLGFTAKVPNRARNLVECAMPDVWKFLSSHPPRAGDRLVLLIFDWRSRKSRRALGDMFGEASARDARNFGSDVITKGVFRSESQVMLTTELLGSIDKIPGDKIPVAVFLGVGVCVFGVPTTRPDTAT